ncbi:MAG: type II toxin-antitoxin system HicB family antitoxin [Spirochaetota bacterium]
MEKMLHIPVLIEIDEDGVYIASCPTLKGCHSYGKTIDEALKNIREAAEVCIEDEHYPSDESATFVGFRELELTTHA